MQKTTEEEFSDLCPAPTPCTTDALRAHDARPESSMRSIHGGVQLATTESEGRFLVASADLLAGTTIYEGRAHAFALNDDYMHACARCYRVPNEPPADVPPDALRCGSCECARYCSAICRDQHYSSGGPSSVPHRLLCRGYSVRRKGEQARAAVRTLPAVIPSAPALRSTKATTSSPWDVDERLVLEILASRHGVPHTCEAPPAGAASSGEHLGCASKAQGSCAEAEHEVASLEFQVPAAGWAASARRREWCDGIRAAVGACAWGASVPAGELGDAPLCALKSRIELNSFDGLVRDVAPSDSMGVGIYLGGVTLLNHSCEPNCTLRHRVPTLSVMTTRRVAKGEPLTISYIDLSAHSTGAARRLRLRSQYGFSCACTACSREMKQGHASRMISVLRGRPAGGACSTCTCCLS